MPKPKLILASGSPRRRQLLAEAGYEFTVLPPFDDVECGVCSENGPAGLVADLAFRKAKAVRAQLDAAHLATHVIVAADTVTECAGFVIGKPSDEDHAREILRTLRGHAHRVLTGVCVWPPDRDEPLLRVAVTSLTMDRLTDAQIEAYLATGQWEGKAGAFGYQDGLDWVHVESGSETNVVGLPMEMLSDMLAEAAQ